MKLKILLLFCLLALFVAVRAGAVSLEDTQAELADALALDELSRLPGDAAPSMEGLSPAQTPDLNDHIGRLLENGSQQAGGALRQSLQTCLIVIAIVVLCGMVGSLHEGLDSRVPHFVLLAGTLGITAAAVSDLSGMIEMSARAMEEMDVYSKVLLPVLAAAAAAAGAPAAAVAQHLAALFFSTTLQTLIFRLLLPLTYAYLAAIVANAALGQNQLLPVARFLKWLVVSLLGLLLTAFIIYITLSGAIASGADAMAIRGAKFAISGAVPVVGGIVGDAADAVLSGAGVLRNSVGIFGLFAILAMCVGPFVRMGLQYLMFKLTAAVAAPLADNRLVTLLSGLTDAFGLLLGMLAASSLVFFISIVATISGTAKI